MKNFIYTSMVFVFLFIVKAQAQYCTGDNRFTEEQYFNNSDITTVTDLVYGNANDYEGNPVDLLMDIRYPSGAKETLSQRPFILMIHGGGFTDNSKESKTIASRVMTQRGFVTATINYRLGYDDTQSDDGLFPAAYRAQQDAFAALRFIVEYADTYGIDTNWLFIEGRSAGASTALNCVFADESEWEATVPGIIDRWGPLNSSGNELEHSFAIKAVQSDCGATSTMAIEPSDMVPMVMFHGEFDHLAPIDTSDEGLAGSRFIHEQLVENGVCSELVVDIEGGHCPHSRDFRMKRAACFFKQIFCDNCERDYLTEEVPANCSRNIVGVSDPGIKEHPIQVYPNPVSSQFNISGASGMQVEILNTAGQLQQTIHPNENLLTVDISAFPSGLYFVKVRGLDSGSVEVLKLVKK
jgi:hypothetical protein